MKKLIFSSLVGLALVAFTGCTTSSDAEASAKAETKCSSGKCAASGKCGGDKAKEVAKKCSASGKCAAGKCGTSK